MIQQGPLKWLFSLVGPRILSAFTYKLRLPSKATRRGVHQILFLCCNLLKSLKKASFFSQCLQILNLLLCRIGFAFLASYHLDDTPLEHTFFCFTLSLIVCRTCEVCKILEEYWLHCFAISTSSTATSDYTSSFLSLDGQSTLLDVANKNSWDFSM